LKGQEKRRKRENGGFGLTQTTITRLAPYTGIIRSDQPDIFTVEAGEQEALGLITLVSSLLTPGPPSLNTQSHTTVDEAVTEALSAEELNRKRTKGIKGTKTTRRIERVRK